MRKELKIRVIIKVLFFVVLLSVQSVGNAQQLAFPGAEGYGKYTSGGRGGIVVEVTNLNDAGTGSLRDALTGSAYRYKKRTIVFRVSGTIELLSQIRVKLDSCITVAGQTAPGDGICVRNFPISLTDSKNIIFRYMRFRLGDQQICDTPSGGCDIDAFSVRKCHHIVLDHCSFSWSMDDILDLTVETGYTTVQYCILSEPLNNSKHSKGAHGYAAGLDGYSYGDYGIFAGSSFHHNLIACANSRSPRLDSYAGEFNTGRNDILDVVNNVIYNWSSYGAYGGEHANVNWQNNYYRYGLNTTKKYQIFQTDGECKIYVAGNYVYGFPNVTSDNTKGIYVAGTAATTAQLDTILITQDTVTTVPINMETALNAYSNVLDNAGATLPARDTVDKRIVNFVKTGTGIVIDSQDQVGGWPELNSTVAPADTDHDGMPDAWETVAGLNPNDASDRNGDINNNGYTDLEDFLNGITISPSSDKLILNENTSGTYCRIYPNPANDKVSIEIKLKHKSNVICTVMDISGKITEVLFNGKAQSGLLTISWDESSKKIPEGVYFCKISLDDGIVFKKILFDKRN